MAKKQSKKEATKKVEKAKEATKKVEKAKEGKKGTGPTRVRLQRSGTKQPTSPSGGQESLSPPTPPAIVSQVTTSPPSSLVGVVVPSVGLSPVLAKMEKKLSACTTSDAPHLIVEARAGTGKTFTLVQGIKAVLGMDPCEMKVVDKATGEWSTVRVEPSRQQVAVWSSMARSKGKARSICFAAFNKSIATELQSRVPAGCEAMTMHSMGFRAVAKAFNLSGQRTVSSYRVSDIIAELLERNIQDLRREEPTLIHATEQLVGLCKVNLVGMVSHGDHEIAGEDQDVWDRELDELSSYYDIELNGERRKVYDLIPRVLERCKDVRKDNCIDYNDMIWLPVVLGLPLNRYDLLLIDEFQDLSRCQHALIRRAGKRLIVVGDPCQPPGTMVTLAGTPGNRWHPAVPGDRAPIETLKVGDKLMGYCPKDGGNYNNREVLGITAKPFEGELVEVTTEDGTVTRYTPQHHCYASFGSLRDSFVVYLMKRGGQFRVGSCQLNYGASGNGLVHRLRTEGGDAAWILEVHAEKREARLREMELSYKYRLPQVVFLNGNQGYILDDEGVDRFWKFIGDNAGDGLQVLDDYRLELTRPVAVAGEQWQQSFKRPAIFAAANLVDGMLLRTEGGRWVKIKIRRVAYSGLVYSLSVSHDKLYMADGLVTHNCQAIYGFAGADCRSMARMKEELEATPEGVEHLYLTVTRRCGKAIVEEAKKIVPDFEAHEGNCDGKISTAKYPIRGKSSNYWLGDSGGKELPYEQTYMPLVQDGDFVLCRVNAPLVSQCFRFLKRGRRANIQGRDIGQGLLSLIKKLKPSTVEDLVTKIEAWLEGEVKKENIKKNPSESKLIALSDKADCLFCFCEGASAVYEVTNKIESVFTDDKNGVGIRLSSVHKAKGLEAQRVFFLMPEGAACPHPMARTPWQQEQELNILYVGITRSIQELIYVS